MKAEIMRRIEDLTKDYFHQKEKGKFIPGRTKIFLNIPTYDWEEVCEVVESLLSTWVTMGKKVKQFENTFAEYIGVRHAIMVNSGSSANLLALSILSNPLVPNRIEYGDEVIAPAVTWITTIWPIINCGAIPVLVDVDLETFNINLEQLERAITEKTKAIFPVHMLGDPAQMEEIMNIAKKRSLFVLEDACEAHGAEIEGKKVGSFGDLATFSFFFSHHISTVEGGMVLTDNEEYAELAKSLRAFGWIRDLRDRDELANKYKDIDSNFLFTNIGYNFRPTELQGAFGIHQIKRLDGFIQRYQENAAFWNQSLKKYGDYLWLHEARKGTKHVWFNYPVTVNPAAPFSKEDLVDFLRGKGVETRPIEAGNIDEQPAMKLFPYRKVEELPNARLIMRNSFFWGNHHGIGQEEREAIVSYVEEFMSGRT